MAKSLKQMTNEEFFTHILRFGYKGAHPAMLAMFMVDALSKWSDKVVATGRAEVVKQMKNSMISGEAWYDAAVGMKKAIEDKYGA